VPLALAAALISPSSFTVAVLAGTCVFSMCFVDGCAVLTRGHGFSLGSLLWVPLRDLLFLCAWARGITLRTVVWRGHRLAVGRETMLSRVPESPGELSSRRT
jgi:ceramide glucosyltransferase